MAQLMNPAIPGPFSNATFIPTMSHGWVHANTWYASVPFNSAPPPVPAGVNPQTWMNGQWRPNPSFQPQPGMTQGSIPSWAPHPDWGAAVQNYNPYKRIPNPGDASYWATKLSDNPLGLENMHIRDDTPPNERHLRDQSNGVPHTPWQWVPKELAGEPSKTAPNPSAQPLQGRQPQMSHNEKDLPTPPRLQGSRDHSRHNSGTRHIYDVTSQRPTERAAPASAPAAVSSYSAYHQQQQQRQQEPQRPPDRYHSSSQTQQQKEPQHPLDRYQSSSQAQPDPPQQRSRQRSRDPSPRPPSDPSSYPGRDYRSHTMPSASSSASVAAAAAARSATGPPPREYDMVFSPKIIRTPDHYSSPSRRHDDVERTPSRTPAPPHGNIYAQAQNTPTPSRSNSTRARRQSSTPTSTSTSTSTSTTPSSSQLGLLTFTEEPQALLSPLVVGSTPPSTEASPSRELTRSHTVGFWSVPEERDHKAYPRTPHLFDHARERERSEWDRDRDENATPQPPSQRTPPSGRTPPSTQYTPESGSHRSRQIARSLTYPMVANPPAFPPPPPNSGLPTSSSYSIPPAPPIPGLPTSANFGTSPGAHHSQSYPPPSSYPSYPNRTSPNAKSGHSRGTSPLRHNPLPRPPAVSAYTESLARGSSSASAAAAAHQQNSSKRMVRKGYWNSRGDHLYVTESGCFIVYAPASLANPEELKGYPSPTEGWRNHHGDRIKYDPTVPELLDSLPRQGKSPLMPYKDFVQYTSV